MIEKMASTFVVIDGEYINLYDPKDNPMLHVDSECYFLFNNVDDVHMPLIGRGIVVGDQFLDGLNRQYIIELKEIVERDEIQERFFFDKFTRLCSRNKQGEYTSGKPVLVRRSNFNEIIENNVLRVDAFFVRATHDAIRIMKREYLDVIHDNILKTLEDVENIKRDMDGQI